MTGTAQPVVEHDGRRYVLRPVDEIAAGKLRRNRPAPEPDDDAEATVPSDRLAAASLRETARKKRKLVERDVVERLIEGRTLRRDRPVRAARTPSSGEQQVMSAYGRDDGDPLSA